MLYLYYSLMSPDVFGDRETDNSCWMFSDSSCAMERRLTLNTIKNTWLIQLTTCRSQFSTKVLHWPVFLQFIQKFVEVQGVGFYLSLHCVKKLHHLLCRHLQWANVVSRITWQQISGVQSARQWYGVLNTVGQIRKVFLERPVLCALALLATNSNKCSLIKTKIIQWTSSMLY